MLGALRAIPAGSKLGDLLRAIAKIIPGNKHERQILLECLGEAGILRARGHDHYTAGFVTFDDRNARQPAHRERREWAYPVRFWTGDDGVAACAELASNIGAFRVFACEKAHEERDRHPQRDVGPANEPPPHN